MFTMLLIDIIHWMYIDRIGFVVQQKCLILVDHRTNTIGPLKIKKSEYEFNHVARERGLILRLKDAGVPAGQRLIDNLSADYR